MSQPTAPAARHRFRCGAVLRKLLALAGYGALAGLILAGASVVTLGGAARMIGPVLAADEPLPASLISPVTPQRSAVYAGDGTTLITDFYDQDRHDVSLAEVAPVMRQAIVAAEDTRFFQHSAVDLKGVIRAFVTDAGRGGAAQGASTLTMQYVRNVRKTDPALTEQQRQAATADTLRRKVQEMRYAVELEKRLSKEDILDRYLNVAYFGHGAYGIDSASHTYFGTSAAQLSLPEAALLAGLVQAPDADDPLSGDRTAATARRAYVLTAMARAGDITPAQARATAAEPLALHPSQPPPNACAAATAGYGFFCDELRRWWETQPQFGETVADRDRALREGGYRIVTTLDPAIQAAADRQTLSVYGYDNPLTLPTAVIQPGSGRILALAVNRHYSAAPGPGNTVDQLVAGGGGVDGYPAGSTFKIFTMLAALEAGRPLDTTFDAPSRLPTRWPSASEGNCDGRWCPANANPSWMDGPRTMWTGFGRSVNTYFVWLEQQIGPAQAVAMAQRLGITFRAASDARLAASPDGWGAFTLGVADTTPLDLAAAYATLAAGGRYCAPLPVISITDPSGHPVAVGPTCRQAVSPDIAAAATDAARCPVGQDSAFGECDGGTAADVAGIVEGRPVAGKTGSTEGNTTETFVAYTPQLAVAAIAADPDNPANRVGAGASPRVNHAVATVLAEALAGDPYQDFPQPGAALAYGAG